MRKKIWIVILLVLLCACGEKEKTDVELAQDAIKDRDREACLLHADDAISKDKENGELLILKASCYTVPLKKGASIQVSPADDMADVLTLLNQAIDQDPDNKELREKADEVWMNMQTINSAYEDLDQIPFSELYEEREKFKVTADNFWIRDLNKDVEIPADISMANTSRSEGGELQQADGYSYTRNESWDLLDRPLTVWSNYYVPDGESLVHSAYRTISLYDHDYFPCTRKDIIISTKEKYFGLSPYVIKPESYTQTNFINMFEYDGNGEIVKSYYYLFENGSLSRHDGSYEYGAFN